MVKVIAFLVGSVTGAIGWWLGAKLGFMSAFFLSTIATGFGMYYGARWAREKLP